MFCGTLFDKHRYAEHITTIFRQHITSYACTPITSVTSHLRPALAWSGTSCLWFSGNTRNCRPSPLPSYNLTATCSVPNRRDGDVCCIQLRPRKDVPWIKGMTAIEASHFPPTVKLTSILLWPTSTSPKCLSLPKGYHVITTCNRAIRTAEQLEANTQEVCSREKCET